MSIIEGVGDEVTQFFITLLLVFIGLVAWWTTRVTENAPLRTVYLLEQQLRVFAQSPTTYTDNLTPDTQAASSTDQSTSPPHQSSSSNSAEALSISEENKPPEASGSLQRQPDGRGDVSSQEMQEQEEEQNAIVQTMDSNIDSNNVLRNRRIAFFRLRNDTLIEETNNATTSSNVNCTIQKNNGSANSKKSDKIKSEETPNSSNDTSDNSHQENSSENNVDNERDDNNITIKLKYINDDLKLVNGKLHELLGDFKRRHFEMELQANKLVRLIFNGQVLQRDHETLQACGMFDNCVVHCLIHQRRGMGGSESTGSSADALGGNNGYSSDGGPRLGGLGGGLHQAGGSQGRDCDLGNLLFALASFILGVAWYFRYEYAQLYTVTSTIALVGLTGVFTVLFVGVYFPDQEPPPPPTMSPNRTTA